MDFFGLFPKIKRIFTRFKHSAAVRTRSKSPPLGTKAPSRTERGNVEGEAAPPPRRPRPEERFLNLHGNPLTKHRVRFAPSKQRIKNIPD